MKKALCILCVLCMLPCSYTAVQAAFSDVQKEDWHYEYIVTMAQKNLVSGYEDGTFVPSGTLTNGEFLTLLGRTFYPGKLRAAKGGTHWASNAYHAAQNVGILWKEEFLDLDEARLGEPIDRKTVCVLFDRLLKVVCKQNPLDTSDYIGRIVDFDTIDRRYKEGVLQSYAFGIVGGYTDGYFRPENTLTRAEACVMLTRAAGLTYEEEILPPEEEDAESTPPSAWYEKGDNPEKRIRIFGTDAVNKYENEAAAEADIVEVCVPVWRLNTQTGVKTASKQYFLINKALADDMVKIFTEIFNDPSQFPIYEIGGYNWRGDINNSEHNSGLAVDINANENYQVYPDGSIGAGSYWKPHKDPHSITEDGIVVKTFEKYGFSWGGNAWKSNKDYMHFSYLGR